MVKLVRPVEADMTKVECNLSKVQGGVCVVGICRDERIKISRDEERTTERGKGCM